MTAETATQELAESLAEAAKVAQQQALELAEAAKHAAEAAGPTLKLEPVTPAEPSVPVATGPAEDLPQAVDSNPAEEQAGQWDRKVIASKPIAEQSQQTDPTVQPPPDIDGFFYRHTVAWDDLPPVAKLGDNQPRNVYQYQGQAPLQISGSAGYFLLHSGDFLLIGQQDGDHVGVAGLVGEGMGL